MLNSTQIQKVATIKEVAQMFNLAKYYIRQLVLQNKVKYLKAGKKYLVNIESVSRFLDGCTENSISNKKERGIND